MKQFPHIRSMIYSQPWAIQREALNSIADIAEQHIQGVEFKPFVKRRKGFAKAVSKISSALVDGDAPDASDIGYDVQNGVAVLDLAGPLFPKANLFTEISGATSYQSFGAMFDAAVADEDVTAICIQSDSPGGSCLGLAELASKIYSYQQTKGAKDVIGFVNPMCASAAYFLLSQCQHIIATESALVGSIGTIMQMDNTDRAERNSGNDPIIITSDELKSVNSFPMTINQVSSMTDRVLAYFGQFKDAVKRGRPQLDVEKVATGAVWMGAQAQAAGLVDAIGTFQDVVSNFGNK